MGQPTPAPPTNPQARPALQCQRSTCTAVATQHWQRQLSSAEQDSELQQELALRDEREYMAQRPMPDFSTYTRLVYACHEHAITPDLATLVHQLQCAGPDSPDLPACTCTPVPAP